MELWVDAWDQAANGWVETGSDPYLEAQDGTSYIISSSRNRDEGNFSFDNFADAGETINSVHMYVYGYQGQAGDVDILRNAGTISTGLELPTTEGWVNVDLSGVYTTWALINAADVHFDRSNHSRESYVDAAYLLVDYDLGATPYQETLEELAAAGVNLTDTITKDILRTLEELGAAGLELEEDFRQHMPVFELEEISTLVGTMERASSIIKENGLNLVPILDQHMPTYTIKEITTLTDAMFKDAALIRLFEEGGDGVNLSDVLYQHMPVFALEEITTLLDVVESTKLFTKLLEELANLEHFFYQHLPTYTISEIATLADVYSKDWTIVREFTRHHI